MRSLCLLTILASAASGAGTAHRYTLESLSAQEIDRRAAVSRPPLVGVHRAIDRAVISSGAWEASRWRVALRSPGAVALRVHFRGFTVGQGRVWLEGGKAVYTGAGPFGDGDFWTETVFGDEAEIVYEPAPGAPAEGSPPFEIAEVAHRFASDTNSAAACHKDPSCYAEWRASASAVALILIELPEGQAACSGALVRTRSGSGVPYFLTANHCVGDDAAARTVEAFWGYETSVCGGAPTALRNAVRSPSGARFVAGMPTTEGDFTLLLLGGAPASATPADWDPAEVPQGAAVAGVHHPAGSFKRISLGERYFTYWSMDYSVVPEDLYYQVRWNEGITEPGSSGSPLFSRPGVIAGVLSYGFSSTGVDACEMNPSLAGYGRFSAAYPYLRPYLEDASAAEVTLAPSAMAFEIANGAAKPDSRQQLVVTTSSAEPTPFSASTEASWLALSPASGTVSAGAPAVIEVSVRPSLARTAGVFAGSVAVTAGTAFASAAVRAEVTVRPSDVAVGVTPAPILAQAPDADGCQWFFRILLEETAGVATRLTLLRIGGVDYTGALQDWFGADRLAASGTLAVSLRARGLRAPLDQLLELAGEDEATGRTWRRTAIAEFR